MNGAQRAPSYHIVQWWKSTGATSQQLMAPRPGKCNFYYCTEMRM